MQKDIYAIYESYVSEGQDLPYAGPNSKMNANHTSRQMSNSGGVGVGGAFRVGPVEYRSEENEGVTKEHKSLLREVKKLNDLVEQKKYEDIIVYCKHITSLAQQAFNTKK
jgi:hypothetical protein